MTDKPELPKHSDKCPKCKAWTAGSTFCEGCEKQPGHHLHYICPACEFMWMTACADASPDQGKSKGDQRDRTIGFGNHRGGRTTPPAGTTPG